MGLIYSHLSNQVKAALYDCFEPRFSTHFLSSPKWDNLLEVLNEDLNTLTKKDPAAHNDALYVLQTYTSFKAVLHYRIAHSILSIDLPTCFEPLRNHYASALTNRGKLLSGADIHPAAKIGRRFVLDHGFGTVIGETTEIGDDCYLLGSVTLGASGIASNPSGRRHPSIGHRVEIGAFARIFGRIQIGDDVFIGPHCVIKEDVPSCSSVTVRTALQVESTKISTKIIAQPSAKPTFI